MAMNEPRLDGWAKPQKLAPTRHGNAIVAATVMISGNRFARHAVRLTALIGKARVKAAPFYTTIRKSIIMFNPDEIEPLQTKPKPRDLQPLSVQELEDYIAALEAEIIRADAMIAKKQAHKNGIDALFGAPQE